MQLQLQLEFVCLYIAILAGLVWLVKPKSSSITRLVFVSILRVETPQAKHCICGMCLHSVVWSIYKYCISSVAFCLCPAYSTTGHDIPSVCCGHTTALVIVRGAAALGLRSTHACLHSFTIVSPTTRQISVNCFLSTPTVTVVYDGRSPNSM